MKNFPFEHNGATYWYSRSVACSMYVFVYDKSSKKWYVLASKRGTGCPSNVGKWNVPGGYLDFDESLEEAAVRECFEETGVQVDVSNVKLASIFTNLLSNTQNVVCSFYYEVKVDSIYDVTKMFSVENSEIDEVEDIKLFRVSEFYDNCMQMKSIFAFGHDKMIREIFEKRIDIPFWKRWIINLSNKLTKINIDI